MQAADVFEIHTLGDGGLGVAWSFANRPSAVLSVSSFFAKPVAHRLMGMFHLPNIGDYVNTDVGQTMKLFTQRLIITGVQYVRRGAE